MSTKVKVTTIRQAMDSFLLSCKVEGKSYGTIECYSDKLKGFLWYAGNYHWHEDMTVITTNHLREFLAYLRDTPRRFNSKCPRAMKPVNSTTIQKYYRALSALFNWLVREELLSYSPLLKIKVPRAEKKVIQALSYTEVGQLVSSFGKKFEDRRNKAMILVLVDCGIRLGELLNVKISDIDMQQQLMKVNGKTGERVVRFGATTTKALLTYIKARQVMNGHSDKLWITGDGTGLQDSSVETLFIHLSRKTAIAVHPNLLMHTFATLWLKNG